MMIMQVNNKNFVLESHGVIGMSTFKECIIGTICGN
jgi:hypothetical protein